MINTWPKLHIEVWPFLWFFKRIQWSISVQLGFPLDIKINYGQTNLKSISQKNAKIANFQPKKGQDATFAPTLNGHNSATFYIRQHQNDQLVETNRIV